jgi:hypothetical protein
VAWLLPPECEPTGDADKSSERARFQLKLAATGQSDAWLTGPPARRIERRGEKITGSGVVYRVASANAQVTTGSR